MSSSKRRGSQPGKSLSEVRVILGVVAVTAAFATACGKPSATTARAPEAAQNTPAPTAPVSSPTEPVPSPTPQPLALPAALTNAGTLATTGGDYVDGDGYREHVDLTVYQPVTLNPDSEGTLDMCPDQSGGSSGSNFTDQVSEEQLQTAGGMAIAFRMRMTSPNAQFPFPLQSELDKVEQSGIGSAQPWLNLHQFDSQSRAGVTCLVSSDAHAAEWVGFQGVLPGAQATPNNPNRKIMVDWPAKATDQIDILVSDPLFDQNTDLGSAWKSQPHTPYGPDHGGLGDNGWDFEARVGAMAGMFLPRNADRSVS